MGSTENTLIATTQATLVLISQHGIMNEGSLTITLELSSRTCLILILDIQHVEYLFFKRALWRFTRCYHVVGRCAPSSITGQ